MLLRMAALALLLFVSLPSAAADKSSFDPESMTRETFSFSAFTEQQLRSKQLGHTEAENSVLLMMKETLQRLFPPGTEIVEFCNFFDEVVARELKNARSIEDQSEYLERGRKAGCGVFPDGRLAVADYRYVLKSTVVTIGLGYWFLPFLESVYRVRIDLEYGRISNLAIVRQ